VLSAVQGCIDSGANVVSLSLGGGGYSATTDEFYEELYEDGVLFVAAAGNGGNSNYLYPASYKALMSVAANDSNENKASFSQYNDQVEISAAGVGVLSTLPGNSYDAWSGTSMATPHVAGVAGLLWLHFPECKNYQIREAMLRTAKDINSDSKPGCDNEFGHGMVQAKDAYLLLESGFCDNDSGYAAPVGGCEQLSCSADSDCDDGDDCTIDTCSSSQCTHTPDCDACGATVCDDGDPCTLDTCNYDSGCSHDFSCALCGEGGAAETVVKVTTDTYYSETSWKVEGTDGSTVISKDSYPGTDSFEDKYCLAEGVYTFTIYDEWGDGICCSWGEGSYEVLVLGESVASGGEFTDEESKSFEVTVPTTPSPVAVPTTPSPVAVPTTPAPVASPPSGGSTPYPTELAPTPYPTHSPPTPYPTEVPPTPHPTHAPPTPYPVPPPTIDSPPLPSPVLPPTPYPTEKNPTPYPTELAPTPWPTHTPPTPHPTGTPPS